MDTALASLIAAATAFAGSHFALSHPLRAGLVARLGERGFQALYSLVAAGAFAWTLLAYRAAPGGAALWDGTGTLPWALASALTLVAAVLLTGSFAGNPALPDPRARALAAGAVRGVFRVTRHPMMWGIALWSAAHALVSPTARVLVLAAALALLALVGAHMQDRKKRAQMGADWASWQARTAFWPRLGRLAQAGPVALLGGLALWLAATWAHGPLIAVAAGAWRWLAV